MSKRSYQEKQQELKRKFDTPWTPHPHSIREFISEEIRKAYAAGFVDGKSVAGEYIQDEDVPTETELAIIAGITHPDVLTTIYLKQEGYEL